MMNEKELIEELNERRDIINSLLAQLHAKDEQIASLTSSLKSVTDMCDEMREFIHWLEAEGCCDCFCDDFDEDDDSCERWGCYGPECPDFEDCECHGEGCCECCREDEEYDEDEECLCDDCCKPMMKAESDNEPESEREAEMLAEVEAMIKQETGENFKDFKRIRTVADDGTVEYRWLKEIEM